MLRSLLRITLKLGAVGAIVAAVVKLLSRRRSDTGPPAGPGTWPRLPEERSVDAPPTTAEAAALEREAADLERRMNATAAEVAAAPAAWVEPDDTTCPVSHPVKAKMTSKVFHLPGMAHYDRTRPDRCYPDAASAEADGLRQAKR